MLIKFGVIKQSLVYFGLILQGIVNSFPGGYTWIPTGGWTQEGNILHNDGTVGIISTTIRL